MKILFSIPIILIVAACGEAKVSVEEMTPQERMQKAAQIMSETGWTVVDIGRVARECAAEGSEDMSLCAAEKGDPVAQWMIENR